MRPLLLSLALLFTACTQTDERLPPSDRFVYPSGIAYRPGSVSGNTNGVLYVSSANFDRCFDWGSVMAVDLDRVAGSSGEALLPLGSYTDPTAAPAELGQLHIAPESRRYIQSFAGEMALWEPAGASPRLFIPARADGNYLHYIDIPAPTQLSCVGNADADNCIQGALSLTTGISGQQDGLPRAEAPFSVFVDTFGIPNNADKTGARLWVTHLNPADSPELSRLNYETYAVDLSAATPGVFELGLPPPVPFRFPRGRRQLGGRRRAVRVRHGPAQRQSYLGHLAVPALPGARAGQAESEQQPAHRARAGPGFLRLGGPRARAYSAGGLAAPAAVRGRA
ncbi:hypothetical protein ACN28E_32720 [Archangium lansingense]|uniref:hypothetical protein n=1 Tax=Archangium lansingense TaxID=2995310 RepID=UPI003B790235